MTTILAIDPAAETNVSDTGWALVEIDDRTSFNLLESGVIHGGFDGFVSFDVETWLSKVEIVVLERYIAYNSDGDSTPRLIEGVVRYLRPDAVLQPSSAQGDRFLIPDSLLKALGVWKSQGHHHDERSAIRHALYYVITKLKHRPTLNVIRNLNY